MKAEKLKLKKTEKICRILFVCLIQKRIVSLLRRFDIIKIGFGYNSVKRFYCKITDGENKKCRYKDLLISNNGLTSIVIC